MAVPCAVLAAALLVVLPAGADTAPTPVGVWPLRPPPPVVRGFDPPDTAYGAGHRGVDLAGRAGQVVRAAMAGRVSYAGRLAGRGVVVLDHGTTRTTYEPVSATLAIGAVVRAGEPVGVLEVAGSHCFPRACLHWGWLRGSTYLDPLLLVGAGPVRLLPLTVVPTPAVVVLPWRPWAAPPPALLPWTLPAPAETAPAFGSGAGVGLLIVPPQAVGGDVGVELRRGQRGVPQQLLDRP